MSYPNFENIKINKDWAFDSVRSIEQWTHGYHRYPAKFLPNVVKKIIENFALQKSPIADPFAGCGTTLVEAKIHGFKSYGVDINPVAELIAKVKTIPISPNLLNKYYTIVINQFDTFNDQDFYDIQKHERIDYWFYPQEKYKIAFLYRLVCEINDINIRNFFLVSLSHILKNCSKWLQSSTKPQIDKNKKPVEPFTVFKSHTQMMMKKNEEYYNELSQNKKLKVLCDIHLGDARNTKWANNSIGTIITSPPYVTSYEYADIHQLTGYWYDYFDDLWQFRQNFIGTSYSSNKIQNVDSKLGQKIVNELSDKSIRIAKNVAIYFNDMTLVAKEMYRVLQPKGKACIVIGNTTVKDVHIQSAEVFWDLLKKAGFQANRKNIIKRSIPYKLMPTLRNIETGRFAKVTEPNVKKVYPNEYILVVEK
ncbi:DNA methyltransferase [Treponema pedis]|uniref:site-specific DNA-methyltransferase (cytosine-N(4)-specific) n=1 Tax=Treponema pedis TaxID=409322 RepID=A0A7S6WP77_9SPIR|nr:DNA methyltransferase [Treponema pedis]QOW60765.1 hypothetical protein IFE08_13425 [Treponema pedis]